MNNPEQGKKWADELNSYTCQTCEDCGQVANTSGSEPWKYWEDLPPGSDLAVRLGQVRPIPCPDCSEGKERQ